MRKKSKKKQIVAMTLALSVLSSSVGMCGASAAEALSDTDDSGLQVTVVPLADSNADTDTSSDDKPTIERPEQSETVETLPGTAEDNKDHIKGEDKDDTEDKGDSGEETPDTGDTDTGDTEEKGEEGSGSEETPEKTPEETPEEKPEETPKEDDTDCSCAYDPDTGHFKITFNIKEDAEGDQTIELSKVQEVVDKYGEKQFDKWIQTDGAKWMDDALWCAQYGQSSEKTVDFNGASYTLYVYYDEKTDSVCQRVAFTNEPGCTTMFDISLSNGSKHTYVYKDNSLTVATPDVSNTDKTGVTGFDGQELPKEYAGNTNLELKYDKNAASGCMEDLVDAALKEYGGNHDQNQFLDSEGNLTTQSTKTNVPAGTETVNIM